MCNRLQVNNNTYWMRQLIILIDETKHFIRNVQRHDKSIRDFTSIADVKSNARHINSIELFIKGKVNLPNIW